MSERTPLVSIVVVNYNGREHLQAGLPSLAALDWPADALEVILVDNAFAFGELFAEKPADKEVPAVRAFNDLMAREGALHSVIVPMGDGLWVGVKR